MNQLNNLINRVESVKDQLIDHPLYTGISSVEDLHIFMETHVYAVWDFMSLLKSLQQHLTCVKTPWIPASSPQVARFINEIVLGEESDMDADGHVQSHFEMYLDAMEQIQANTQDIKSFTNLIQQNSSVDQALTQTKVNEVAQAFVAFTFSIIETGQPHKIAAAFTFGREDLIPDMFIGIVKHLSSEEQLQCDKLIYYLERHIEMDGDEHGPLSLQMVEELCGDDANKWAEATEVAVQAMQTRINLWNGIAELISKKKIVIKA